MRSCVVVRQVMMMSLLFMMPGPISAGRISRPTLLGYTEKEKNVGYVDDAADSSSSPIASAALLQLELKSSPGLALRQLQVAVNALKCEPPFIAQTIVNISESIDYQPSSDTDSPSSSSLTTVSSAFISLNRPFNLNVLLSTAGLNGQFNRTLRFCLKLNDDAWIADGLVHFPPVTADTIVYTSVTPTAAAPVRGGMDASGVADGDMKSGGKKRKTRIGMGYIINALRYDLAGMDRKNTHHGTEQSEPDEFEDVRERDDDWLQLKDQQLLNADDDVWGRVERVRRQGESGDNSLQPRVLGISLEKTDSKHSYTDDGRITMLEGEDLTLLLIGQHLSNTTNIKFTTSKQEYGEPCGYELESHTKTIPIQLQSGKGVYGVLHVPGANLKYYKGDNIYYLCVQDPKSGNYVHQGMADQLQIEIYTQLLPTWLSVIMLVVLLMLSGLFSGLNLGLMSLDQTELRIVVNTGSEIEKSYAKAIMPIRGMGNFLLCSILLGNVLVNNTLTILLDTLTGGGGVFAVIGATLGIVVFGEIIPQAICSRHGLAVGAKTIWLTKFFMFLTAPLAFPISKILDKILGAEIGTVYNRERLMELIKVTDAYTDLEKDEVNIVTGALVLKRKTVKDVMTRIDDCYMLKLDTTLNFETISEIKEQGYSRIPVYDGDRCNVKHILFAKDLLFIDPDDNKPLEEVCKFYHNDVNFVYQDTILTDMFDEFKSGEKGHMAMVQEANTEGDGDPYYETVGLLTLEDIIEEIIQQEINDETDVILDNKTKKKRKKERPIKDADFKMFLETKTKQRLNITPHLSFAILQFLTTSVKAFSGDVISARILQKLLNMDVYREVKLKTKEKKVGEEDTEGVIMMKGKPCDFFILILEGRVQVTIGKEDHKFIEGPFTTFGEQMLEQAMMLPSSPMVSDPARGTSLSLSMHSSVNEVAPSRSLRKTNTQVHLETASGRRSCSADAGLPSRAPNWLPDYTVKAITDVVYLKIRKATYLVALKASRMNNMNSESGGYNEKELDYALERVTEDDDDNHQPQSSGGGGRSPEKYWEQSTGVRSTTGTPTDMRRESLRSSLSMIKSKFLGGQFKRSSNSIDRSKDDFWDGMANPAMDHQLDETGQSPATEQSVQALSPPGTGTSPGGTALGSSPGGLFMTASNHAGGAMLNSYNMNAAAGNGVAVPPSATVGGGGIDATVRALGSSAPDNIGPLSLPLKQRSGGMDSQDSDGATRQLLQSTEVDSESHPPASTHPTVITVRGSGLSADPAIDEDQREGDVANEATAVNSNDPAAAVGGNNSTEEGRSSTTTGSNSAISHTNHLEPSAASPTDRTSLLGGGHGSGS